MKTTIAVFSVLALLIIAGCAPKPTVTATTDNVKVMNDNTDVQVTPQGKQTGAGNTATTTPPTPASTSPPSSASVSAGQPEVKEFDIVMKQFSFDPATINVNKGDTVKLHISSIDTTHGFAIDAFGVNEKITAGSARDVEFVADKSGTYSFFCSQFCGSGHSGMRGELIVK